MPVVERREQRARGAGRAEEHRADGLTGDGVRDGIDSDPVHCVSVVDVVADLHGEQPGNQQHEHDEAQSASPARDRKTAGERHREERGRDRDHVAIEEQRRVAVRRDEREEEHRRGDGQRAERERPARTAHEQRADPDERQDGEVVQVVTAGRDEVQRILPDRTSREGPAACRAGADAVAVPQHVQRTDVVRHEREQESDDAGPCLAHDRARRAARLDARTPRGRARRPRRPRGADLRRPPPSARAPSTT